MICDKQSLLNKLYEMPQRFRWHMQRKEYSRAKAQYDNARTVALFLELNEQQMIELFGERGERGVVISRGLFPEDLVQKSYLECIKRNETHENQKYPGIPSVV